MTNSAESGIVEEISQREPLFDDIISEIDENSETKRVERDEKTEAKKKLLEAGARIWEAALVREAPRTVGVEEDESIDV